MGDIESQPYLEAIRQLRYELGHENTLIAHLTLVPYLKKMGGFVTHHYHRDWVKNKIAKVYRKGLELVLHLDPKDPEALILLMNLDQLEQSSEGLPYFSYVRNLNFKHSQFYSVYAEYCLYLGDVNEASFAILKALSQK